jgi:hypothetical protein
MELHHTLCPACRVFAMLRSCGLVLAVATFAMKPPAVRTGIDPAFECGWRELAMSYALELQPQNAAGRWYEDLYAGLQLQNCNISNTKMYLNGKETATAIPRIPPAPLSVTTFATIFYVDGTNGNDTNSGNISSPFQTIPYAVTKAEGLPRPAAIYIREGVYRFTVPLALGPEDSFLLLSAYENESVVFSGGTLVAIPEWNPYNVTNTTFEVFQSTNSVYGTTPNGVTILNYTRTDDWESCQDICSTYPGCTTFTWHDSTWPIEYKDTCWMRTDGVWTPVADAHHVAGYPISQNVWTANIFGDQSSPNGDANANGHGGKAATVGKTFKDMDPNSFVPALLYSYDAGKTTNRATRARWPNANPEVDLYPLGWMSIDASKTSAYIPAPLVPYNATTIVHVPLPDFYQPSMFGDYYWGYGGPCSQFIDNGSYWCQPFGRVANETYFVRQPIGFVYDNITLPHAPYPHSAVGGVFNFWRQGHWFSLMSRINTDEPDSKSLGWTYGAFQGAEGEPIGEDWFIEWVLDELDAPNEFFLDFGNNILYYYHNGTGPPPMNLTWESPFISTLISINGTQASPVQNISIFGIEFTSTAPAYLEPHGIPRYVLSRMPT